MAVMTVSSTHPKRNDNALATQAQDISNAVEIPRTVSNSDSVTHAENTIVEHIMIAS